MTSTNDGVWQLDPERSSVEFHGIMRVPSKLIVRGHLVPKEDRS